MDTARIGILGAARIAHDGIVVPARATGSRLVAIAARDRDRARNFAAQHGVERVAADYAEVIEAPDVDIVYNPLPNSMHAPWNLAAITAGKHVLSEKPFASNAAEARMVRDAAARAGVVVADGFHYRYHPIVGRLFELLARGELGAPESVEAVVVIPRPADGDLRLSRDLAGGAVMDGGCYALHAVNLAGGIARGEVLGGAPRLVRARGREFPDLPGVDETVEATFEYPQGATGSARCWMAGDRVELSLTVTGSRGSARVENFILPQEDDRLTVSIGSQTRVERLGNRSSYSYQLEAVLRAIRYGDALATDGDDAVHTMELVDAVYRAAGMLPRGLSAEVAGQT